MRWKLIGTALALAAGIWGIPMAHADLVISSVDTATLINFDGTLAGSNNGQFTGAGLASGAPTNGQLDSESWRVGGMSDGTSTYGGSFTTGDFARGSSTGGVTTGGLYAFDHGAGDLSLGVQPTSGDFTPGFIELKLANGTGTTISDVDIGYEIWYLNDQNRANSLNFAYSLDGTNFTPVNSLDFTTPEAADASPSWARTDRATTISGIGLAPNANLYLRWTGDDVSGSGSRDEYAIDDISITFRASAIPEPSGLLALAVGMTVLAFRRRRES